MMDMTGDVRYISHKNDLVVASPVYTYGYSHKLLITCNYM